MSLFSSQAPAAVARTRPAGRLAPPLRKLLVSVHILSSVALAGAVCVVLALGVEAQVTGDPDMPRMAFRFMDIVDHALFPPLAIVALASGIALSWRPPWRLVDHWWILVKFALLVAVIATGITLTDRWVTGAMAAARDGESASADAWLVLGAAAGHLAMLAAATVISVYKPWGRTPAAQRAAQRRSAPEGV
jgi:uncharacterized membrane protein